MCFHPPPRRDCKGRPALWRGSGNPAWEAGNPRKTSSLPRRRRRRGREEENQGTPLDPGQERLPLTTRLEGRSKQRTFDRKVCFVSCQEVGRRRRREAVNSYNLNSNMRGRQDQGIQSTAKAIGSKSLLTC